jgi:hypothetical protein
MRFVFLSSPMNRKREKIEDRDLRGFKYFKRIRELLEPLHAAACTRDRAHNRDLHMDDYLLLLLLHMFNPICVSLRSLQQASTLKKVQRVLGVPRSSLGSLSEAARVFDSSLMLSILEQVAGQLKPLPHDARLDDVSALLTAMDGTLLPGLAKISWALWKDEHRAVKAHVQLELLKGVPVAARITEGNGDERDVLAQELQAGRLYVLDRGYASYPLMQKVLDAGSSFVVRLRDNSVLEVLQERELSPAALAAGVVRDAVVSLGGARGRQDLRQRMRIVEVACRPHVKRYKTGVGGPAQGSTILLATDRLDLPAEVIALIYQHRWAVEIFFRTFKHLLGCRHLLSTCKNGIELQTYAAILACLLIALYTGRRPTLRSYEMLCWYFMGWADQEEMEQHIRALQKQM